MRFSNASREVSVRVSLSLGGNAPGYVSCSSAGVGGCQKVSHCFCVFQVYVRLSVGGDAP